MIEFTCLPKTVKHIGEASWVEVACIEHHYRCGHHHRRWGPVSRCMARHVQDASQERSEPVGSTVSSADS